MLGVKNNQGNEPLIDEETRVWFNELRASGFVKKAGYASNVSIGMNLADLGTFNATGSLRTTGYGDIEQKISDRARENTFNYGFATNLQLDKLIPKKVGLKIPVYASYDKKIVKPQFNPLNPDVELKDAINNAPTSAATKTALLDESPYLSDEVLTLTVNQMAMNETDAKDILVVSFL